ncbi:MAG: DUF2269 family protein [Microthrixaceae bacterium]
MFAIETGAASNLYRVVLLVHLLLSIAGFGGVLLNGVYAAKAKQRQGLEGLAISEANYGVSGIAEVLILLVPVSGLALVWASGGAWALSDLWVWLSIALFAAAFAVSRAVLMPGHRRVNGLLTELVGDSPKDPAAQVAEVDRIGRTMGMAGGALNLLLVAIIVLMIWKPV